MDSFEPTENNCRRMKQLIIDNAFISTKYEDFDTWLNSGSVFLKEAEKYPEDSDEHKHIVQYANETHDKIIEIAIARNFETTCDCWDDLREKIAEKHTYFDRNPLALNNIKLIINLKMLTVRPYRDAGAAGAGAGAGAGDSSSVSSQMDTS